MSKNNKVFLDNLPRKMYCGKDCIDWDKSIGYKVKFIYNNIKGYIEIVKYIKNDLIVKYNDNEIKINMSNFKNCMLKRVLGLVNIDFVFNIGDIINVSTGKIKILKQLTIKNFKNRNIRWYSYKCLNCGNIDIIRESDLKNNVGCNVCCSAPRKVLKGYNDVATTHPHLIKYFKNIEDVYTHTSKSHKTVEMICNICGCEKKMRINTLFYSGFSCNRCSDGKSYGEKFIFNLISKLNINFEIEKYFNWSDISNKIKNRKIYDFYFKYNNEDYIIEAHGIQHYDKISEKRYKTTLEEEQENDKYKKELAINNGIKEENYIVIDCRKSELEWIKKNILNSRLNEIFDLSNFDWLKCDEYALSSRIKEVCDLWNIYKNVSKVGAISKLNKATIRKYLKIGNDLRWCLYDSKKAQKDGGGNEKIPIKVISDGKIVGVFNSKAELQRNSEHMLGVKLYCKYFTRVLNTDNTYKNFYFKS